MLDFMDYVLRAFEECTGWNSDNSYEKVDSTSNALLKFSIPTSLRLQTSSISTSNIFSTLEVAADKRIVGSLAYLYTNADNLLDSVKSSSERRLQWSTETYRHARPIFVSPTLATGSGDTDAGKSIRKALYYGRICYPTSTLEAMYIRRMSLENQIILKVVSNVVSGTNAMLVNWQHFTRTSSHEFLYLSNGALCGYRTMHNFLSAPSKFNSSLYNNSTLSLGGEVWLGLSARTPGCSTTLRYCTYATNTGRPLTLTFAFNPLFGHISSTYSAKTSSNSTFCARYDFNLYSTDSNLSLGCELWKRSSRANTRDTETPKHTVTFGENVGMISKIVAENTNNDIDDQQQRLLSDFSHTFSSSLQKIDRERLAVENFESKLNNENFTSVWKLATSLRDKTLRLLWEGKFRGFLLSAGAELSLGNRDSASDSVEGRHTTPIRESSGPNVRSKFGITIQYAA